MIEYIHFVIYPDFGKDINVKKLFSIILFILGLSACVYGAPVYRYEKTTPITDTVYLTQVEEFHFDHNMSYSYITADLNDENISLELIKSDDGVDKLDYLSGLCEDNEKIVAAVNGDFFSSYKSGLGFSLGLEYSNGSLLQSPIYPETMAATYYDGQNVVMQYIEFEMTVSNSEGLKEKIRHLNKHTDYYGDILMYTSVFNGGYAPAPTGEIVAVVVDDGIVSEFIRNSEKVKIPENGCVLMVSEGNNMFFSNNFEVGDEIIIEYSSSPNLDGIRTAFGGGSMLVFEGKDVGKIGDYAHTVAGLHPRTAIGIDKSGTKLTLLTVDGRQEMSRGMRMSHLAELLIDLGCYYAVNLDGGGSTRMLASTITSEGLKVANNPTENRKVINGVGIAFDRLGFLKTENVIEDSEEVIESDEESEVIEEPHSDEQDDSEEELIIEEEIIPAGLLLVADRDTVFKGDSVNISLYCYDEHMRKIDCSDENVEWSCTGGSIVDGVFFADCSGEVTVSATLGDLYADTDVYVAHDIDGIDVEKRLVMNVGDEYTPNVSIFDYNGKYMTVTDSSFFEITSSDESVVEISDFTIIAKNVGTAVVTISKDNAKSFISVAVGTKKIPFSLGFEKGEGMSMVYPDDVKGSFSFTDEIYLDGSFSGRFDFDFTIDEPEISEHTEDEAHIISVAETQMQDDIAKAVYYVLSEDVPVDENCNEVKISVYSDSDFNHKVRVQLEDSDGKSKLCDFEGEIVAGEWCELVATIPDKVKRPVSVKRVYVLYSPGEEKDKGTIFVDNLTFDTYEAFELPDVVQNVYRNNLCNTNTEYVFRVGAEKAFESVSPVTYYLNNSLSSKIRRADNFFVLSDENDYGIFEDDYAFYISLDTSGGGIRNTDSKQWQNIVKVVSQTDKKYLFLLCNNEIFCDDDFENRVIVDYLASLEKEVFVISRSHFNSYKNLSGVKYFTLDKTPSLLPTLGDSDDFNCVEFRFGDKVTFEFV